MGTGDLPNHLAGECHHFDRLHRVAPHLLSAEGVTEATQATAQTNPGLKTTHSEHSPIMSHKLPKQPGQLLGLGNKIMGGLVELGESLGITQTTPETFGDVLFAFEKSEDALTACRAERQAAADATTVAMTAIVEWLAKSKNVLAEALGRRWSPQWAPTGFSNHSTRIPTKLEDRLTLTGRLVAFLASRPSFEMHSIDVTASFGAKLHETALRKRQELTKATGAQASQNQKWTTAFKALTEEISSLIKTLKATLDEDDSRWPNFGLPMPSARSTPRQPANVRMQLDESGGLVVECDPVPLATRYRCRMLLLGEETEFRLVASGAEPILKITGLLPGQAVQVMVQAVNRGLQSVASRPQIFVLPEVSRPEPRLAVSRRVIPIEAPEPETRFSQHAWTQDWDESDHGKLACVLSR